MGTHAPTLTQTACSSVLKFHSATAEPQQTPQAQSHFASREMTRFERREKYSNDKCVFCGHGCGGEALVRWQFYAGVSICAIPLLCGYLALVLKVETTKGVIVNTFTSPLFLLVREA